MNLGTSIKQLRQDLGLTQAAFASQIGITPSFLSSVERGAKNLSSKILLEIQGVFNVPIDSILLGKTENSFYTDIISTEMKTIGNKIKELRKNLGMTQIEFAQRLGIAQGFLSHIERGEVNFSSDILLKIKQEFDVDISTWTDSNSNVAQTLNVIAKKNNIIQTAHLKIRGMFEAEPDAAMIPEVVIAVQAGKPKAYLGDDISGYVNMRGTFIAQIVGNSMIEAGLHDGDEVIMERKNTFKHNDIIISRIDDEYTIKQVKNGNGYILLNPANPEFEPIKVTPDLDFECMGVWTGFKRSSKF